MMHESSGAMHAVVPLVGTQHAFVVLMITPTLWGRREGRASHCIALSGSVILNSRDQQIVVNNINKTRSTWLAAFVEENSMVSPGRSHGEKLKRYSAFLGSNGTSVPPFEQRQRHTPDFFACIQQGRIGERAWSASSIQQRAFLVCCSCVGLTQGTLLWPVAEHRRASRARSTLLKRKGIVSTHQALPIPARTVRPPNVVLGRR
jgi:hypothetical protein